MRGAAPFGTRLVITEEPTAALGVKKSGMVLDLIRRNGIGACRSC